MLVLGESDHAVADVTGGEHVEVFAKAAGGAAVVGDSDDGGEVADEGGSCGSWLRSAVDWRTADADAAAAIGGDDITFEAAEEGGKAGATTDGNDADGLTGCIRRDSSS
jgi:hypothetical protein